MARFSNRLAHFYWDVDDGEVYRILTERLSDLERFLREFGRLVTSELEGGGSRY